MEPLKVGGSSKLVKSIQKREDYLEKVIKTLRKRKKTVTLHPNSFHPFESKEIPNAQHPA